MAFFPNTLLLLTNGRQSERKIKERQDMVLINLYWSTGRGKK